ncbi:MAG: hypothetical protein ACI9EF_002049 [Pseudohongiellaceae bacterium]|jgi:hypothetical protein
MAKARSGGRSKKSADFEIEESQEQGPPAGIEGSLVLVTFVALAVALVLSQIELGNSFGQGMLGG